MPNRNLLERTRELLRARPSNLSYQSIVDDTPEGINISVRWLEEMSSTNEMNPRFNQVQFLHDYLMAKIQDLV